ncbi:hypothetical protein QQP08_017880 [Theobroma cacao]|nr:hypothetical protein QQP08_017880 [Theobroma cacao]
MIDLLLEV